MVSHADIVAKASFKGCEVTLVFSRTKEAELRIGNDTRGTASSWIREEENAGKKDIKVKKTFSLNPTRIESEESKALDVLFQLPSHFWSKFGESIHNALPTDCLNKLKNPVLSIQAKIVFQHLQLVLH